MARFFGKFDDLVLDGRAVARPDPFDASPVHGGALEIGGDQLVGAGVGVGYPAGDLGAVDRFGGVGKGARGIVARLLLHAGKVDGPAVEARRRTGLETADFKAERDQPLRGPVGRLFSGAAGAVGEIADVDFTSEKGAGSEHYGVPHVGDVTLDTHAFDAAVLDVDFLHQPLANVEVFLLFAAVFQFELIRLLVRLGAGGAHGRAFASVEAAELNSGQVDVDGHLATQGVDLLDHMSLTDATDSRVARHLADTVQVDGEEQSLGTHAGGCQGSFGAGVAAADDDDVVGFGKDTHLGMWNSIDADAQTAGFDCRPFVLYCGFKG